MQGLGDEEQVELCLRVVGECGDYQAVPPYLSVAVEVVEAFRVGDLIIGPDISMYEPEEDLVVAIGELYVIEFA